MPWCPNCRVEYEASATHCADCDSPLAPTTPPNVPDTPPMVVLRAANVEQADIACATLQAEGIIAHVDRPGMVLPQVDNVVDTDSHELEVRVAAIDVERAVAILNELAPSEEELTELEEATA